MSPFIKLRHPRDFTSHTPRRGTLHIQGSTCQCQAVPSFEGPGRAFFTFDTSTFPLMQCFIFMEGGEIRIHTTQDPCFADDAIYLGIDLLGYTGKIRANHHPKLSINAVTSRAGSSCPRQDVGLCTDKRFTDHLLLYYPN